jgi:pyrroline-5-carboxylate reductase
MQIQHTKIAVIGGGNIGSAITRGLLRSAKIPSENITLTRRNVSRISEFSQLGVKVTDDNISAVHSSELIIFAVLPSQLMGVIDSLKGHLKKDHHILVSVVSAFSLQEIISKSGGNATCVRAMPNIAAAVGESMTCLCANTEDQAALEKVKLLFDMVGSTLLIPENLMSSATILGACGIAFFMRYIRAASQGGIQVGFHAAEAQFIAAQTARGATSLLLESGNHPEREIDKVTTPMGCTIAGLNEMEHNGLSSALIKGIVLSYNEINKLK